MRRLSRRSVVASCTGGGFVCCHTGSGQRTSVPRAIAFDGCARNCDRRRDPTVRSRYRLAGPEVPRFVTALASLPARPGEIVPVCGGASHVLRMAAAAGNSGKGMPGAPVTALARIRAAPDTLYPPLQVRLWHSTDTGRSGALAMDRAWIGGERRSSGSPR